MRLLCGNGFFRNSHRKRAFGFLLWGWVFLSVTALGGSDDSEALTGETGVIEFSAQLEVFHEPTGHLLYEWGPSSLILLSGHEASLSSGAPHGSWYIELAGALVDGTVHVEGNTRVTQKSDLRRFPADFVRFEGSFEMQFAPDGEARTIEIESDEDDRRVMLTLSPSLLDPAAGGQWLRERIGRFSEGIAFSLGRQNGERTLEETRRAHAYAQGLAGIAEGVVSKNRTRELVELFEDLLGKIEAEQLEDANDLLLAIDRASIGIREDLEAWEQTEGAGSPDRKEESHGDNN